MINSEETWSGSSRLERLQSVRSAEERDELLQRLRAVAPRGTPHICAVSHWLSLQPSARKATLVA